MKAVNLIREEYDLDNLHCFILDESEEWFLVSLITEFHLDGYCLVRKSTVNKIRYNKFEKKYAEIHDFINLTENFKTFPLALENNVQIFTDLSERGRIIYVEDEVIEDRFIIGRIEKIEKNYISMSHFTADGKWWKRNTKIRYNCISKVSIDSEYVEVWEKFLEAKKIVKEF